MTQVRVGKRHIAWRSENGVTYHFDRWVDHHGTHYQIQTHDLVVIKYELNHKDSFRTWYMNWIEKLSEATP